jgi:hypothetical protein
MAEGSRDYWRILFEFHPISNNDSPMKDVEVKRLLCSMMEITKRYCNKNKWHVLKRNPLHSAPARYTPSNLTNVLKLAAMYDSFGALDTDRAGYQFKLFTLDKQDEMLNLELHLGGDVGKIQHGNLAFRFDTSWETFFYKSDYYQFIDDLLQRFNLNSLMLESSPTKNHYVGNVHYFSNANYYDFFVFIKKHFKIVTETEQGILVEFCKINKKNRLLNVLELPHVKTLYDMLVEQFKKKNLARNF